MENQLRDLKQKTRGEKRMTSALDKASTDDRRLEETAKEVERKAEEASKKETRDKMFRRLEDWKREQQDNASSIIDDKIKVRWRQSIRAL